MSTRHTPERGQANNYPLASVAASGVILAGGLSRRLGRDKALVSISDQPLIQRVIERVEQLSQEILVVVADQNRAADLPLAQEHRVVFDRYPGTRSLGGIFSGLDAASNGWTLVVACDMPFLNLALLRRMMALTEDADAVVPLIDGRPEPTHALYSKACLPFIEPRLISGDLKISGFYDQVRVRYLSEEDVAALDPEFLSFFNVNTPEDLDRALSLAAQGI
ncbi:MAG: molybdenum cofactor guanylyltransferase [Chloroflexota bacterium]|nr:molybdenum cofactor guanylyltransferase [Chloroflexota bacterium]